MTIFYANNKLKKQFSNASEIKTAFGQMAKKVSERLADIRAAPNLAVLMQLPAAKCHPLTGNRQGDWAVSISGNYRLIFTIGDDPIPLKDDTGVDTVKVLEIVITGTEDYH